MAAVRHLGFSKVVNFDFRSRLEAQYASPCQISQIWVKPFQMYDRFSIFKDGCLPPSRICFTFVGTTHEEHLIDIVLWPIFHLFKMAAAAILNLSKLEISTSGLVRKPNKRHHTKFLEDRLRSVEPFRRYGRSSIFKMASGPPSWIFKSWKFYMYDRPLTQINVVARFCALNLQITF